MHSSAELEKTSFAAWQRQVTELQKVAGGIRAKQSLFPEE